MDPITAVGLAASVIAIVQAGFKVIKTAKEIRDSSTGSTKENENRRTIGQGMNAIAYRLSSQDAMQVPPEQQSLINVAGKCQGISKRLLDLLDQISVTESGIPIFRKWGIPSLRGTAKAILKQGDIEALEKELVACRAELIASLLEFSRAEATEYFERILSQVQNDAGKLDELRTTMNRLRGGVMIEGFDEEGAKQLRRLMNVDQEALLYVQKERLLKRLEFEGMGKRSSEIHRPHAATFEWIFEDNSTSVANSDGALSEWEMQRKLEMQRKSREEFLGWLASPGCIFHISGKLGSGKSTLMKFLSSHERTKAEAEKWAGDKQLTIATFFFWRHGLNLQNSLQGLRRSLLYDILKRRPDLIPETMPETWGEVSKTTWHTQTKIEISPESIEAALQKVLSNRLLYENHRFCFFIDGLDEHLSTNHEDHQDLVALLRGWTKASDGNLKLCVSSREENDFMTAYSGDPSLRLHDLTWFDMREFVLRRLKDLADELRLEFADTIPTKAEGIFFWTSLVVCIIRNQASTKNKEQLRQHLKDLEPGLKELFKQILEGLTVNDRRTTYQLIALLKTAKANNLEVSMLAFSFLEEYEKDKEFSTREDFLTVAKDKPRAYSEAPQRLRAACGGLVELKWEILEYTHRSVPEMFDEENIRPGMEKALKDFNAIDALSHLIFAQVQSMDDTRGARRLWTGLASMRLENKVDKAPYHTHYSGNR
ncbi:hypothetical protein N0V84_003618 [Fusarium piperis]|uniref:Nephrocystin 3-like N-terminal domain-containing protein n=1 Tax=Fusarium piperis TaxID=1435070 RepID=A0A9W8WHG0_9HYPO|nr:hypothetical protein N0V84_003618 [Fusarium piperis]